MLQLQLNTTCWGVGRSLGVHLKLFLFGSMFPVSEPVEKLEGRLQSTGEAKYVDDIPRGEDGHHHDGSDVAGHLAGHIGNVIDD